MITEYKGNLLNSKADVIAHQTNCAGVMGAGVALQIKEQLLAEGEYLKYVGFCNNTPSKEQLGGMQLLKTKDHRLVANLFGQNRPQSCGIATDYDALKKALNTLHRWAKYSHFSVAVPGLLGCGLAGGDWKVVRQLLEEIFSDDDVSLEIVYFDEKDFLNWVKYYKGYVIEDAFGMDGFTVFFEGDDVFFDTRAEAIKFIDGINKGGMRV